MMLLFLSLVACTVGAPAWFNGINIPWHIRGADIGTGNFDHDWFETFFVMCKSNHLNSARFFLHDNGQYSPVFTRLGHVRGLPTGFLEDLTSLVTLSAQYEVVLTIVLWDFTMIDDGPHRALITDVGRTSGYVSNALIPIVTKLAPFNNVVFEIMSEPEWLVQGSVHANLVRLEKIQQFTAMLAEAIHANSNFTVTTGSASLRYNSNSVPPAEGNWWNDDSLIANNPSGSSTGVLDFYSIHYSNWMYNATWGFDICREPTYYWQLDKPTVVAYLPAYTHHYETIDMVTCSYKNGYVGDIFWAYNDKTSQWADTIPILKDFYEEHADVATYNALTTWLASLLS